MKVSTGILRIVVIGGLISGVVAPSSADENTSPLAVKTKEIVEAAYTYILKHSDDMKAVQHALRADPRFFDHKKRLYVFIHCYNVAKKQAIVTGQGIRPELIGKNLWNLRTPSGRLLFQELAGQIEKEGQVWQEYEWLNPYTSTIQTKRSLFKGVVLKDGRKCWVGSGYWIKR